MYSSQTKMLHHFTQGQQLDDNDGVDFLLLDLLSYRGWIARKKGRVGIVVVEELLKRMCVY